MSDPPHVIAVCGSLRDESYTRRALRHALDAAAERGATTELVDLREYDLPVYDPDDDEFPAADRLRETAQAADSVILGTPVYHGSYATPLKNALDYCGFDEFDNTTVGLLCVSGGGFPVTSLDHLRSVCRALNAWVIPHQAALPKARTMFDGETFVDESAAERVATLGHRAVEYANIEPDPRCLESTENVGADD
jgi:NAD(P)H-dependent FMN reductase